MRAWIALGVVAALARAAAAEPAARTPRATLAPTATRAIHAPTGWLLPSGQLQLGLGVSHRRAPAGQLALGIGGVGELELALDDRLIACVACDDGRAEVDLFARAAAFRVGVASSPRRRWRAGAVLGLRRTIATRALVAGGRGAPLDAAALHLVAAARWGGLELHGGGELHDARHADARLPRAGARAVRPLVALAWAPPPYPRTTMLVDLSWSPERRAPGPRLGWLLGWGVRYQALSWGAIELVVRQRAEQSLGDATVLVQVTGAVALGQR